jgi:hypothetical protein
MMREARIKQICDDWSDKLATFLAAYPGRDPMACTLAVFDHLVNRAPHVVAFLHGFYSQEMERKDIVNRMNREILLKARFAKNFPTMFPDEVENG